MSLSHELRTQGENIVFSMMKYILENEYEGISKDNAKYFCQKVAQAFEDDLDDEAKSYFLDEEVC